jgi:ABC-type multidrug transport system fused ATPase/permease subunit
VGFAMVPENQGWAAAGWVVAIATLLGVIIRQIGPWRRQISEAEEGIRKELHEQIDAFKEEIRKERLEHATEMRAFNLERDEMGDRLAKMEKMLSRQQIRHNAERALDRHRLNNITACFDSLLMLLKANPEKSSQAVKMIEDMRAKQILAEAEEKAIIRAAEIRAEEAEFEPEGK